MGYFSFNHASFGKTTQRPGAAAANVRYNGDLSKTQMDNFLASNLHFIEEQGRHRTEAEITYALDHIRADGKAAANVAYNARPEVTYAVRGHVIPTDPDEAAEWFLNQEINDRKNARMSDRYIGGLERNLFPEWDRGLDYLKSLDPETLKAHQSVYIARCIEMTQSYCEHVTGNRTPWHFGLHLELDKMFEPDWNPHTHVVIRDRDIETGRRALYTSAGPKERRQLDEKGIKYWTTENLREAWQDDMNNALERADSNVRVDRRSYKDRGIDRVPQEHEGPKARRMQEKGLDFESRDREKGDRTVFYTMIDAGSRISHNAAIVAANDARGKERAAAFHDTLQPTTREQRDALELRESQAKARHDLRAEQRKDRVALYEVQAAERDTHRAWSKDLYADAREKAFQAAKQRNASTWKSARAIRDAGERKEAIADLKQKQKNDYKALSAKTVTTARGQKDKTYKAMQLRHLQQAVNLKQAHKEEFDTLGRQHLTERAALMESYRAYNLQNQATRLSTKMAGNQNMAAQQMKALQLMRLRQQASQTKTATGPIPVAPSPAEAARAFVAYAKTERDTGAQLRRQLTTARDFNSFQAKRIPVLDRRAVDAARPPRTPAEAMRFAYRLAQQSQNDNLPDGRTMTDAERASASPQARERADRQERAAKARHGTGGGNQKQERKNEGRGPAGGGRGR